MSRSRRLFLQEASLASAAAIAGGYFTQTSAQESKAAVDELSIGIMGVNGRGSGLAQAFGATAGCRVTHLCDVDSRALARCGEAVEKAKENKPKPFVDIRKMLEEKSLDVLVCAAPNHWHAPAVILGCAHGKHVYVEKPCSQNAAEGEMAVAAARKHNRVVGMGTQRRSWPAIQEGIKRLHAGELGRVYYARAWYDNNRPTIGRGKPIDVPEWLNYDLWQGPAPERPLKDNLLHYNWHWHWHWGNGELGNNGIHCLDVARWGLQVDFPIRVSSGGGRYRFEDDQETPDTQTAAYDFPDRKAITWEGLSCSPFGPLQSRFGITFHGEKGTMSILETGYQIYDLNNKEIKDDEAKQKDLAPKRGGDSDHVANFIDCVRTGKQPNADIEIAHKSTLLCHLGNIAYRTGRTLKCDPANGRILNDTEAMQQWGREYRKGWEPVV